MNFIWGLIGGFRGIVFVVIIILLGSWGMHQYLNLQATEKSRLLAVEQRDTAALARDKAIQTSNTNLETIQRLEEEKKTINEALTTIASARSANRETATTRQATIQSTSSVAKNSAPAAPVLGSLIQDIQAERVTRRAGK